MSLLKTLISGNIASNMGIANSVQAQIGSGILSSQYQQAMSEAAQRPRMKNKTIFSGRIEVQQVTNGYIVHIASREGYEFDSHIAASIKEVNDLISTAIVAFQLEA